MGIVAVPGQGNGTQRSGSSSAALTITYTNPTTSGDLLVLVVTYFGTATVSVADNQGNTWLKAKGIVAGSLHAEIWYVQGCTGGASHQVTITPTAAVFLSAAWGEWTGGATAGGPDQTNAANATSASPSTGNVTTTAAGELYVAVLDEDSTSSGVISTETSPQTWTNVYTARATSTQEGVSLQTYGDGITAAAGTYAGTWSMLGSIPWAAAIASFQAAAAVAPAGPLRNVIVSNANPYPEDLE